MTPPPPLYRAARASAVALLVVVGLALSACGGDDSGDANGQTITVFAAASLTDAFRELASEFEAAHPGASVKLSFAGSATLRTQLQEGALADLFASASPDEVEAVAAGLVLEQRALAGNTLVVAVAEEPSVAIDSYGDLAAPGVRLVLTAEDVPAGRYARESLALADEDGAFGPDFAHRVLANVRSNESNVRASVAKVELGEADAAIVYASDLARAGSHVTAVVAPARFQVAVEYRIALLSEGATARAFLAFATSPEGAAVLARHGFAPVGATP